MKFEVGKLYKVTKTTRKGNVIKITEDLGYGEYKYEVVTNVKKDLVGSFVSGSAFADSLKPVEECIVIYRKYNDVIALDKSTGRKGIAKCSPEDKFDFGIGAKLAFERLTRTNIGEPDNEFRAKASVFKGMVTAFEESGFTRPEAIRIVIRLANGKSDAEGN